MNEQSPEEKMFENPPVPPTRDIFAVGFLGLPLSSKDNVVCFLVVVLAVVLQIRLNDTLLGEGWLALFGFVGYLAMRLWLLKRRYSNPGEIVIEADHIFLPASVNFGKEQVVNFSDLTRVVAWFFNSKSGGRNLTSVELITDRQNYCINWLMVDLNMFERSLLRRELRIISEAGSYERLIGPVMFVFILVLVLFLSHILLR